MNRVFLFLLILFAGGCLSEREVKVEEGGQSYPTKVIYYLDSYHSNYRPNQKTRTSFTNHLSGREIVIHYGYLDEKNVRDTRVLAQRGKFLFSEIQKYHPDLIVVADDPALNYVVIPYLKDSATPIVFIGINWSHTEVGKNMTGQIEVELIDNLVQDLTHYAKGIRIGILTARTSTDEKSVQHYEQLLKRKIDQKIYVNEFDSWKREYQALQNKVDILIVRQNAGIANWDQKEAEEFVLMHTKIPTGTPNLHMAGLALFCYPKLNEEYGEYAAKTAIKIFSGISPSVLPIEKNKRTKVTVNMALSKKLGIKFSPQFIENVTFYSETTNLNY